MSAISLKSITGITSITTPAGVDNQLTLHNNNTTEAVKLDIAGNLHFHNHLSITGVSTFSDNVRIVDNKSLLIGNLSNGDLSLVHDGNNSVIRNRTGNLYISNATQTGILVNGTTGVLLIYHLEETLNLRLRLRELRLLVD